MLPNDPNGMTAEEAWDERCVRIAKYYGGVRPTQVRDEWSWEDIYNTLQVMEADRELALVRARR